MPITPVFTPITAAATVDSPQWPAFGVPVEAGTGVVASLTLPIVLEESQEPILGEDDLYLFQEG